MGAASQRESKDDIHRSLCHSPRRARALPDQVLGLAEDEGCGREDLHGGPHH